MRNDIEKARERRQAILSAIVCGAILLALAAGPAVAADDPQACRAGSPACF